MLEFLPEVADVRSDEGIGAGVKTGIFAKKVVRNLYLLRGGTRRGFVNKVLQEFLIALRVVKLRAIQYQRKQLLLFDVRNLSHRSRGSRVVEAGKSSFYAQLQRFSGQSTCGLRELCSILLHFLLLLHYHRYEYIILIVNVKSRSSGVLAKAFGYSKRSLIF